MKKILPLLLIGAAGFFVYNQYQTFKTALKVRIGKVAFNLKETQRTLFTKIIIDLNLIVTNGSKLAGMVTGGKIDVYLQDKLIGTVSNIGAIRIEAAADTTIPVQVGIATLSLVNSISDLIKTVGKGLTQTVNVRGNILTSFGTLTINEKVTFKI
jgi:hypothetical protein